jgi:hypothetical protein
MATHTQTGRACKGQCIRNYHALIDEKETERIIMLNEKEIEWAVYKPKTRRR